MSVLAILALVAPGCSSESGPAIDIDLQATSGLPLDSGVPMSCKVERNDFLEFLRIEEGLQTNAKELPGIAKCVRNQLGLIDATSSPLAFVRVVAGGQPVGLAQSFDVGSVRHITLVTDEERLNTSNFPRRSGDAGGIRARCHHSRVDISLGWAATGGGGDRRVDQRVLPE